MATLKDIAAALKGGASPIARAGQAAAPAAKLARAASNGTIPVRPGTMPVLQQAGQAAGNASNGLRNQLSQLNNVEMMRRAPAMIAPRALIGNSVGGSRPSSVPMYGGEVEQILNRRTAMPAPKVGTALNPGVSPYQVASNRGLTPISSDRF